MVLAIIIGLMAIKIHVSPIQRKLIGSWNIEFENSYIERDSVPEFSWTPMVITKNTIRLPIVHGKSLETFFEDHENRIGTWQVISRNPDSIFINVPNHFLHGMYAVRFFIDKDGWVSVGMRNNIYKMELRNDSTSLILNKASVLSRDFRNWEGRN